MTFMNVTTDRQAHRLQHGSRILQFRSILVVLNIFLTKLYEIIFGSFIG